MDGEQLTVKEADEGYKTFRVTVAAENVRDDHVKKYAASVLVEARSEKWAREEASWFLNGNERLVPIDNDQIEVERMDGEDA